MSRLPEFKPRPANADVSFMHRNRVRLRTILGILLAISLFGGAPVMATHNIDHAEQQIAAIVKQAEDAMAAVVNQFANDAPTARTEVELDNMENAAKDEIDAVRNEAARDLESIRRAYQELGPAVQEAKSVINASKIAFKTRITDIADSSVPPGITTTTAPPGTTTTTTAPPGITTTTTAPPNTTATTAPPPATTTAAPILVESPGGTSAPREVSASPLDPALKPPPERPSDGDDPGSSADSLTGSLTNGLSVVLPPTVATAVLSPLIVFEVLLGTLVSSVRSLVPPTLLLLASWFLLMPRRRNRSSAGKAGNEA